MRKTASIARIGAAQLVLVASLHAGIRFETDRIELEARPDRSQVKAVFELENRDDAPAEIVSVHSGCQCLSAQAGVTRLEPGAKTTITAVFDTTGLSGLSEKKIQVKTREAGEARLHHLTVAVRQPEWIRIEPRTIVWFTGEEKGERTFHVTMSGGDPIHLLKVEPSNPGFEIRQETVKDGREYRIHVKPPSEDKIVLGVFRLKTDFPHPRLANPVAFGHVRQR